MSRRSLTVALLLVASCWRPAPAGPPVVIPVAPGESVQAALDGAASGAVLQLEKGVYDGDLDFRGKAVTVRGVGPATVLRGSGEGSVVRFASGEDERSVLDSVRVVGGRAVQGGGIYIAAASPCVVRCMVSRNRASSQGSGIFVGGGSTALLFNNLVTHNRNDGGDPHGVEIVSAAPVFVNNTVARTDSNGVILRGASAAVIANNVLAHNGKRVGRELRGRGICDFSGGRGLIRNNVFHRNRIAALLRDGRDWNRVRSFEKTNGDPNVTGNVDGAPGFRRTPSRRARRARPHHFKLRRRGRAIDRGLEDAACEDADGSRNDAGHTGGPFAQGSALVPTPAACAAVSGR